LAYLASLETAKAREVAGDAKAMKALKPVNYIVLTDGAPSGCTPASLHMAYDLIILTADDPEDVIVTAARRLDRGNFSITQVCCDHLVHRSVGSPIC